MTGAQGLGWKVNEHLQWFLINNILFLVSWINYTIKSSKKLVVVIRKIRQFQFFLIPLFLPTLIYQDCSSKGFVIQNITLLKIIDRREQEGMVKIFLKSDGSHIGGVERGGGGGGSTVRHTMRYLHIIYLKRWIKDSMAQLILNFLRE